MREDSTEGVFTRVNVQQEQPVEVGRAVLSLVRASSCSDAQLHQWPFLTSIWRGPAMPAKGVWATLLPPMFSLSLFLFRAVLRHDPDTIHFDASAGTSMA
ncbi:putative ABC transporter permease protein [Trichinella spiralis]|uniref:putative ABC transporter permease protein n=1 Tax=Trichinella spiralis TaxID=6334 RepID=UPI0001EFECEF|nr:putative ABC transporter permease protein [Trichinella spiralis]